MEHRQDLLAKRASLTAGIVGAVMVVFVCFGAALAFSDTAGATTGEQSPQATVPMNVQADGT